MIEALQQLALVDALRANWGLIRLQAGSISAALNQQFITLGERLQNASSIAEVTQVIDDLLDLTKETPAAGYVRELVMRSSFGETSTTRSVESLVTTEQDLQTLSAAPAYAQESCLGLGALLGQSSELSAGVTQVPVFFATNRKPAERAGQWFSGEVGNFTSLGLGSVTIPTGIHQLGALERPQWWNLFANKEDRESFFTLSGVETLKPAEFTTKLESAAGLAEAPDLLIFLHGFNVTFEEAALRAAQFAHDSKFRGIVVLFSWPSQGRLPSYSADEDRALASSDRLAGFLRILENGPWRKVHLLAHSMGNRVMLAGLADNPRPKLALGQIIFAAADVYVPVFEEKFPKLQDAGKLSATSYASKKDVPLWISSRLHRGTRIGMIEQTPYVTDYLESIDATAVDNGLMGHGYWSAQRPLINDLQRLLHEGLGAKLRQLDQIERYWAFPK